MMPELEKGQRYSTHPYFFSKKQFPLHEPTPRTRHQTSHQPFSIKCTCGKHFKDKFALGDHLRDSQIHRRGNPLPKDHDGTRTRKVSLLNSSPPAVSPQPEIIDDCEGGIEREHGDLKIRSLAVQESSGPTLNDEQTDVKQHDLEDHQNGSEEGGETDPKLLPVTEPKRNVAEQTAENSKSHCRDQDDVVELAEGVSFQGISDQTVEVDRNSHDIVEVASTSRHGDSLSTTGEHGDKIDGSSVDYNIENQASEETEPIPDDDEEHFTNSSERKVSQAQDTADNPATQAQAFLPCFGNENRQTLHSDQDGLGTATLDTNAPGEDDGSGWESEDERDNGENERNDGEDEGNDGDGFPGYNSEDYDEFAVYDSDDYREIGQIDNAAEIIHQGSLLDDINAYGFQFGDPDEMDPADYEQHFFSEGVTENGAGHGSNASASAETLVEVDSNNSTVNNNELMGAAAGDVAVELDSMRSDIIEPSTQDSVREEHSVAAGHSAWEGEVDNSEPCEWVGPDDIYEDNDEMRIETSKRGVGIAKRTNSIGNGGVETDDVKPIRATTQSAQSTESAVESVPALTRTGPATFRHD